MVGSPTTGAGTRSTRPTPTSQRLHAKYPFIVTWDDHEVTNDQWKAGAENHEPERGRLPRPPGPRPPGVRRVDAGADGRHRRARRRHPAVPPAPASAPSPSSACSTCAPTATSRSPAGPSPAAPEISDPDRTITGARRCDWLKDGLRTAGAQWKLVGNPVMIAPVMFPQLPQDVLNPINDVTGLLPDDGAPYNVDQWDGYTADRREVFAHIRRPRLHDTVFLTGDIHSGWAGDLPLRRRHLPAQSARRRRRVRRAPRSPATTSRTSPARRRGRRASRVETAIKTNNRHVKYLNFDDHGFSVLDITSARAQMDWFVDRRPAPTGRHRRRLDASWATDVRHPARCAPSTGRWCLMCDRKRVRQGRARPPERRTFLNRSAPAAPRLVLLRDDRAGDGRAAASASTCWSSTAAGPRRSTAA